MRAEVAIVGNGVAGTACALRLARHGIRPLLIGRGLPVDRPPLTKAALARGEPVLLADEERLHERGVDRLDGMVDELDLAAGTLRVGEHDVEAAAVVLATGLSYRPPRIPGLDVAHVNATPGGLRRLAAVLTPGRRRVAVIGAGLIGVETAATLAGLGHAVTLLDVLPRPLDRLHDPLPTLAEETLRELGVTLACGAAVVETVARRDGVVLHHARGEVVADVVVAATGGLALAPPGIDTEPPLSLDPGLRLPGRPSAYACGDLVLVPHARFGPIRFPHWDAAIGTGEHVADGIAGVAGPYERLPYWWSDIGPRRLAEVGVASLAAGFTEEEGLHVGRDASGEAVCVLVVDAPRRLREARALLSGEAR